MTEPRVIDCAICPFQAIYEGCCGGWPAPAVDPDKKPAPPPFDDGDESEGGVCD